MVSVQVHPELLQVKICSRPRSIIHVQNLRSDQGIMRRELVLRFRYMKVATCNGLEHNLGPVVIAFR